MTVEELRPASWWRVTLGAAMAIGTWTVPAVWYLWSSSSPIHVMDIRIQLGFVLGIVFMFFVLWGLLFAIMAAKELKRLCGKGPAQ
jgi:hypothetical protein